MVLRKVVFHSWTPVADVVGPQWRSPIADGPDPRSHTCTISPAESIRAQRSSLTCGNGQAAVRVALLQKLVDSERAAVKTRCSAEAKADLNCKVTREQRNTRAESAIRVEATTMSEKEYRCSCSYTVSEVTVVMPVNPPTILKLFERCSQTARNDKAAVKDSSKQSERDVWARLVMRRAYS